MEGGAIVEVRRSGIRHRRLSRLAASGATPTVAAGSARRSARHRGDVAFGWDNEFDAHDVHVPEFDVDVLPVTNAEFLEFLNAGGYSNRELWSDEGWSWIQADRVQHPAFWMPGSGPPIRPDPRPPTSEPDWKWRGMFEAIPLPADWPVYVSHAEASAYARWKGRRLMTEPEFHRAAEGSTTGHFDFAGFDPIPVGSHPPSAAGVYDLVGNGWEWTSTVFAPFDGFVPMRSYPEYSADFFDGQHYVMKGASPATASELVRRASATGSAATIRTCTPNSGRRAIEDRGSRIDDRQTPATLTILDHRTSILETEFAADVRRDLALTPKQLQSKYLYDALGSSLFEAICRLPWYRITRAERALPRTARAGDRRAPLPLARALRRRTRAVPQIVELGCGSGEKIVILAEALQSAGGHGRVHLIDISPQALEQSERTLGRLEHISVVGHRETYEVGLRRAAAARDGDHPVLVLLLGSNIGNFDMPAAHEFLCAIRGALAPGDALLLGADLVKPERELQLAYDDPLGRDGGVQPQPARPHQPRARRHVRPRRLRPRRGVEPRAQPHRDAPREPRRSGVTIDQAGLGSVCERRADLDGELLQVRAVAD